MIGATLDPMSVQSLMKNLQSARRQSKAIRVKKFNERMSELQREDQKNLTTSLIRLESNLRYGLQRSEEEIEQDRGFTSIQKNFNLLQKL